MSPKYTFAAFLFKVRDESIGNSLKMEGIFALNVQCTGILNRKLSVQDPILLNSCKTKG